VTDLPTHLQGGTQRVEFAEKEAERFAALSDAHLVGLIGLPSGNMVRDGCAAELQRRLRMSIDDFNKASTAQAKKVINLTWALVWLTVVLGFIAIGQVLIGFRQIQ
jgi:hypothetical protein